MGVQTHSGETGGEHVGDDVKLYASCTPLTKSYQDGTPAKRGRLDQIDI